jgi:hypothetical protein
MEGDNQTAVDMAFGLGSSVESTALKFKSNVPDKRKQNATPGRSMMVLPAPVLA